MKFIRRPIHIVAIMALSAAATTCAGDAFSQPTQKPKARPPKNAAAASSEKRTEPPIQIAVTAPEKSAEDKEAERKRAERQDLTNENIARYTFWLVLVGAGQALGTFFAFAVSLRAANAAKRSADVATESLLISERGYLSVRGGSATMFDEHSTPIDVSLINRGRTPVEIQHGSRLTLSTRPPLPEDVASAFGVDVEPQTVQASEVDAVTISLRYPPLPLSQRQSWQRSELVFVLEGTIRYRDRFVGTPVHRRHISLRKTQDPIFGPLGFHPNPGGRNDEVDEGDSGE
jgi:hypothetical protein